MVMVLCLHTNWHRTRRQSKVYNRPGWLIPDDRSYQSGSNPCDTTVVQSTAPAHRDPGRVSDVEGRLYPESRWRREA